MTYMYVCAESCPTLYNLMNCSPSGSLSMKISRQQYWNRLPLPTPGDLRDPGIEPASLVSPANAGDIATCSLQLQETVPPCHDLQGHK